MGSIISALVPAIVDFVKIATESIEKKETPAEFRARLSRSSLVSDDGWEKVIKAANNRDDFVNNG